jgi:hypothetical protein
MTDEKYPKHAAYAFLEEIQRTFTTKFTEKEINVAIAYHLNDSFKNELKSKMVNSLLIKDYFNIHYEDDNISKLKKGVMNMKDNVLEASEILNQRGEKIQLVIKKADGLRSESKSYYSDVLFYLM